MILMVSLSHKNISSKENTMKSSALLFVFAASLVLSACNTIEGVGRDVSSTGRAVTGTASSTKERIGGSSSSTDSSQNTQNTQKTK
jgi:predicted small secreted protein